MFLDCDSLTHSMSRFEAPPNLSRSALHNILEDAEEVVTLRLGESAGVSMEADELRQPPVDASEDIADSIGELEVLRDEPIDPETVVSGVSLSHPCQDKACSRKMGTGKNEKGDTASHYPAFIHPSYFL